jgi:hypothetical protein
LVKEGKPVTTMTPAISVTPAKAVTPATTVTPTIAMMPAKRNRNASSGAATEYCGDHKKWQKLNSLILSVL